MRPLDVNGTPVTRLTGELVTAGNFVSSETGNNVMIWKGSIYILNETDGDWYKLRCNNNNDIPTLFLDDTGITRGLP